MTDTTFIIAPSGGDFSMVSDEYFYDEDTVPVETDIQTATNWLYNIKTFCTSESTTEINKYTSDYSVTYIECWMGVYEADYDIKDFYRYKNHQLELASNYKINKKDTRASLEEVSTGLAGEVIQTQIQSAYEYKLKNPADGAPQTLNGEYFGDFFHHKNKWYRSPQDILYDKNSRDRIEEVTESLNGGSSIEGVSSSCFLKNYYNRIFGAEGNVLIDLPTTRFFHRFSRNMKEFYQINPIVDDEEAKKQCDCFFTMYAQVLSGSGTFTVPLNRTGITTYFGVNVVMPFATSRRPSSTCTISAGASITLATTNSQASFNRILYSPNGAKDLTVSYNIAASSSLNSSGDTIRLVGYIAVVAYPYGTTPSAP